MVGAIAPNAHEGHRSEYLAQYVLSSWGTAVAVGQPEDYGVDFFCSFVEHDGRRAWAHTPYAVQVKSNLEPWVFEGERAVRWLTTYPLPLYLCAVDKAELRLRFYHTLPRFVVWCRKELAARVQFEPGTENEDIGWGWKEPEHVRIAAPIVDITLPQFLDDGMHAKAASVLEQWAKLENENISRMLSGIGEVRTPIRYKTNEPPTWKGGVIHRVYNQPAREEVFQLFKETCPSFLAFLGGELFRRNDAKGAALTMFLFRHLFPSESFPFDRAANECWGASGQPCTCVEELEKRLSEKLARMREEV